MQFFLSLYGPISSTFLSKVPKPLYYHLEIETPSWKGIQSGRNLIDRIKNDDNLREYLVEIVTGIYRHVPVLYILYIIFYIFIGY